MGGPINIFDQSESRKASEYLKLTALSEITGPMAALGVMAGGIMEHLGNQEFLVIPDSVKNEAVALFEIVGEAMPTMLADIAKANGLEGIDEFAAADTLSVFVPGWDAYFRGQPAPGSDTFGDSENLDDEGINEMVLGMILGPDCGNPDCEVHGTHGLASMLREAMADGAVDGSDGDPFGFGGSENGFDDAPDWFGNHNIDRNGENEWSFTNQAAASPFTDTFGRNGYTKRQLAFLNGEADSPGCSDPNCSFCNNRPGFSSEFEEIDLNDVDPDSDLGQLVQSFANAGINVAGGRIYAASVS